MKRRWTLASPPMVSETELAVLKVLWEQGPVTVRELQAILHEQGRAWAYTTVQTLLARLEAKGIVRTDRTGSAHVYEATVSRDQMLQQRLTDLADQLCEGTSSPLVLALVEGGRFTAQEIEKFRSLLDRLETDQRETTGGGQS
jgi:BlaI family transcriptional regulator, penicillinase repressor